MEIWRQDVRFAWRLAVSRLLTPYLYGYGVNSATLWRW
jgi:hypothetical protein